MSSLIWGLTCFVGLLAAGTLGSPSQFGSRRQQIHSISPLIPRVSPQVSPRLHERVGEIKSIEQTSEEVSSSEGLQEIQLGVANVRTIQQQGARSVSNPQLTQERGTSGPAGRFIHLTVSCIVHVRSVDAATTSYCQVFVYHLSWFEHICKVVKCGAKALFLDLTITLFLIFRLLNLIYMLFWNACLSVCSQCRPNVCLSYIPKAFQSQRWASTFSVLFSGYFITQNDPVQQIEKKFEPVAQLATIQVATNYFCT